MGVGHHPLAHALAMNGATYLPYVVRREVDPRHRILPPWERKPEEYGPAEREELNRKLLEALGVLPDAAQHARARRRPPR